MAELIVFTGTYDPDFLEKAVDGAERRRTSPQDVVQQEHAGRKKKAHQAKMRHRMTLAMARKVTDGWYRTGSGRWRKLTSHEEKQIRRLNDGSLRRERNRAVQAWGHGTLVKADGTPVEIGGSTGGLTRELLDGCQRPHVDEDA